MMNDIKFKYSLTFINTSYKWELIFDLMNLYILN